MTKHDGDFHHPHDTLLSSGLRFASELIAWVAGTWAASLISDWLISPVLILLIGLPSIFSTINDKRNVVVATSGMMRILNELLLYSVALITPWFVWSTTLSIMSLVIVVTSLCLGASRFRWLIHGAPSTG